MENLSKKSKPILLLLVAMIALLIFGSISASAMTTQGHDQGSSGMKIYSDTWFFPGYKTNSDNDSKLKDGKWAKSCWSKVKEGDDVVYKATRTLTAKQAKTKGFGMQEAYASQKNNPLKSQKYNYNWKYL